MSARLDTNAAQIWYNSIRSLREMHENRFFRGTGGEKSGKAPGKLADKVVFALLTSVDFETALKSFLSGNQLQSYPIALCENVWFVYMLNFVCVCAENLSMCFYLYWGCYYMASSYKMNLYKKGMQLWLKYI